MRGDIGTVKPAERRVEYAPSRIRRAACGRLGMAARAAGDRGDIAAVLRVALRQSHVENGEERQTERERAPRPDRGYSTRKRNSKVANDSWQELQARPTACAAGLTAF